MMPKSPNSGIRETSVARQQLVKTHFLGSEYAHNSRGTAGGSILYLVCPRVTYGGPTGPVSSSLRLVG
jgi:hypothetical protein